MNLGLKLGLGSRATGGGSPPVTGFVAVTRGSANGTSTTLTVPVGVQSGDTILMLGVSSGAGNEVTPPAGWSTPVNTGGYSFAHRAHAGAADYAFTVGSTTLHSVLILFFRGYTVGVAGTAFSGLLADPVPSAVTVPNADSINVALVGSISAGVEWSAPAGWTLKDAGSNNRSIAAFQRDALVGTGPLAGATFTRTAGATNGRAIQVALSPA